MCRMILFLGREPEQALTLVDALVEASRCDPLLPSAGVARRGHRRHLHGWGYALVGGRAGRTFTLWEQRETPLDEDASGVARLKTALGECGSVALIAHSRLASAGGTDRPRCHPFHFRSPEGTEFFLAHNGSMLVKPFEERLVPPPRGASDTMLLGQWLQAQVEPFSPGRVLESLERAKPFTETAMNTFSLWAQPGAPALFAQVTSHVAESERTPEVMAYFRLYRWARAASEAWMSSAVALRLEERGIAAQALDVGTSVSRSFVVG